MSGNPFEKLRHSIIKRAENLATVRIAEKVIELQTIISSINATDVTESNINIPVPSSKDSTKGSHEDSGCCCNNQHSVLFQNGMVLCNKHMSDKLNVVREQQNEFLQLISTLRMWLSFIKPTDAFSDRSSIREEIMELEEVIQDIQNELNIAEAIVKERMTKNYEYHKFRGELVINVAKYPNCEDYREALKNYDIHQSDSCKHILVEIHCIYVQLQNIFRGNVPRRR